MNQGGYTRPRNAKAKASLHIPQTSTACSGSSQKPGNLRHQTRGASIEKRFFVRSNSCTGASAVAVPSVAEEACCLLSSAPWATVEPPELCRRALKKACSQHCHLRIFRQPAHLARRRQVLGKTPARTNAGLGTQTELPTKELEKKN